MNRIFYSVLLSITVLFIFIVYPLSVSQVNAQEQPDRWTPEIMAGFKTVGGTATSPDGKLIAYTVSEPQMEGEISEYLTHIWMVSADGSMNYQFTQGNKSCVAPAFSPDGKYLAFISSRGKGGKRQVWISPLTGGEAEQLTESETGVITYSWSPDGTRVAYLMNDPESAEEKNNNAEKRDMKVLDTNYKYSHLYTVTVDKDSKGARSVQRLTSGDFHIKTFDWSPDGSTIVFGHQINPSPDEWFSTDISTVPSDSGAVSLLVSWKGSDRDPRYSPNGRWISFVSDGGEPNWALKSDVYIMSAQGGEPRPLTLTPDRSFTYYGRMIGWSADSTKLYVREASRTFWRIYAIPSNGDKVRVVTTEPGTYTGASVSRDGTVMSFVRQTSDIAPDVYITGTKDFKPRKLTVVNAGYPDLQMGKTEVITWKSGDYDIEGLLTYPVDYIQGRQYPMILYIHGGPHSFFSQTYTAGVSRYPLQAYAQEGYAVLRPNPRGSSGYGKDFRYANINDWGFGDYDDCMAGVDHVIGIGIAHPDCLCVIGWSYGGYMTSFIVTKTDRFKAASMGAGLSNLMSFTGTTDIPGFIPNYFDGEYWDNIDAYMKHSANFRVKGVTTPTLILHGENDKRVPLSQGIEFYHALKRQGCPTEMVIYPRTWHSPREPKFIIDIGERIIDWFDTNLDRKKSHD